MNKDEHSGAIFHAFQKSFRALQGDMPLGDFAKKLEMSQALVRTYLDGTRFPDSQGLQKISELCGVSVDWLLGRSDFQVKEHANITAQEMGLSEKAALFLQNAKAKGAESPEGLYPQLVSMLMENKHFTRFIQQVQQYKKRVEEMEQKLKGAAPSMRDFYAYRLKSEKAAVAQVLGDLLSDMADLPGLQEEGKKKG